MRNVQKLCVNNFLTKNERRPKPFERYTMSLITCVKIDLIPKLDVKNYLNYKLY